MTDQDIFPTGDNENPRPDLESKPDALPSDGKKQRQNVVLERTSLKTAKHEQPEVWKKALNGYRQSYGEVLTLLQAIEQGDERWAATLKSEEVLALQAKIEEAATGPVEFKAEAMLDTAMAYANEAIGEERLLNELKEKFFVLKQEIDEYLELSDQHDKEVKAGFYTLPHEKAQHLEAAERHMIEPFKKVAKRYSWLYEKHLTQQAVDAYAHAIQAGPMFAASSLFKFKSENYAAYSDTILGVHDKNLRHVTAVLHGFRGHNIGIAENLQAGVYQAWWSSFATMNAAEARNEAHAKDVEWTKLDKDFREKRTEIADKYMGLKLVASQNGDLNFAEQVKSIALSYVTNLMRAQMYYTLAKRGLKTVFGIEVSRDPKTATDYVLMLADLRDALDEFMRRDQGFVVPVSLKAVFQAAGQEGQWKEGLETGHWKLPIGDGVTSYLKKLFHVRAQGVSAYVTPKSDGGSHTGFWKATIKPPSGGHYRYLNGNQEKIDQSHVPPVITARVRQRDTNRQPDIVGINVFNNISPIGDWIIELDECSHTGEKRIDAIDDVEIDIHVAMQQIA